MCGLYFHVQGYLAHKKPPFPLGPPYEPRHGPTVGSYGVAVSYERGTPVQRLISLPRDLPSPLPSALPCAPTVHSQSGNTLSMFQKPRHNGRCHLFIYYVCRAPHAAARSAYYQSSSSLYISSSSSSTRRLYLETYTVSPFSLRWPFFFTWIGVER